MPLSFKEWQGNLRLPPFFSLYEWRGAFTLASTSAAPKPRIPLGVMIDMLFGCIIYFGALGRSTSRLYELSYQALTIWMADLT